MTEGDGERERKIEIEIEREREGKKQILVADSNLQLKPHEISLISTKSHENLSSRSSMSPLVAAALAGNCAVAQRLLAASATAEAVDAQGRTALAAAAATGSGQLLGLLKITIYR